jgi:hypothetical protein
MTEHHKAQAHDHIRLITYHELPYLLRRTGFTIERVTTVRLRKCGLLHAWAWPFVRLATRRALVRESDPRQREANREISAHLLSSDVLFGRTLMLVARKPA